MEWRRIFVEPRREARDCCRKRRVTGANQMRGKRAVVLSSLFALSVLAGGAVYAELQTGDYTPATLGSIEQSAPRKLSANSTYQINSFPTYSPDLEPGDGMEETRSEEHTSELQSQFH